MARRSHSHVWDRPHRGFRRCLSCYAQQTSQGGEWAPVMTLKQFADTWLPMVSGTNPRKLMHVDVAAPFEWNCYESWNIVYRVTFDFSEVQGFSPSQTTPSMIMHGWQSEWRETFNFIDKNAREEYEKRTGAPLRIGDNTYEEMRRIIQS